MSKKQTFKRIGFWILFVFSIIGIISVIVQLISFLAVSYGTWNDDVARNFGHLTGIAVWAYLLNLLFKWSWKNIKNIGGKI